MQVKVQLWDGREFDATVASRDTRRDLALLRIGAMKPPFGCVADSSQVRPGELAIAIGNPLGFVGALTTGVIHTVVVLSAGSAHNHGCRPMFAWHNGNSGGPLADARGCAQSELTQWSRVVSRLLFRVTWFETFFLLVHPTPGLV